MVTSIRCEAICAEAVAIAEATGGGPGDPVADVVGIVMVAACTSACAAAVHEGLTPHSSGFDEYMCHHMRFHASLHDVLTLTSIGNDNSRAAVS